MRTVDDPAGLSRLGTRHEGLIAMAQCRHLQISSDRVRTLVASESWRPVVRGVYDTTPDAARDPDAIRRRAAWLGLLAVGPDAMSVGCCALALHGVAGLPRTLTPEVAMIDRRHVRGPTGVRVRRYRDMGTAVVLEGWAVSDVPTALVQALPGLDRLNAVAVLDHVVNRGVVGDQGLAALRARMRRRRGSGWLARIWLLVDGRAESPLETWARVDCVDAGLPPDRLQVEVRDPDGVFVGRVDMVWFRDDGSMVAVEIDGQGVHADPGALYRDRGRQNRLMNIPGVTVLRFTIRDLHQPGTIARAVRAALAGS